jgi:hypothetical protein
MLRPVQCPRCNDLVVADVGCRCSRVHPPAEYKTLPAPKEVKKSIGYHPIHDVGVETC